MTPTLIPTPICFPHPYSCINMFVGSTRQKLGENYYKELEQKAHSNRFNPATKQVKLHHTEDIYHSTIVNKTKYLLR